jgi:hypothetical protein
LGTGQFRSTSAREPEFQGGAEVRESLDLPGGEASPFLHPSTSDQPPLQLPAGPPPAGMFLRFSCWNRLGGNVLVGFLLEFHEKRFHSSSLVPLKFQGHGILGDSQTQPSPPSLPTTSGHLICIETQRRDSWASNTVVATAAATRRCELKPWPF